MPTTVTSLLSFLLAVACALALAAVVRPDWASPAGPTQTAGVSHDSSLDDRSAVLMTRIRSKEQVVSQLLEGEIPLDDAVEAFRFLNANPAWYPETRWQDRPGATDGEKLCNEVMLWVNDARQRRGLPQVSAEEAFPDRTP